MPRDPVREAKGIARRPAAVQDACGDQGAGLAPDLAGIDGALGCSSARKPAVRDAARARHSFYARHIRSDGGTRTSAQGRSPGG